MNPLYALTTRGASSARNWTFGLDRPAGPLNHAGGVVIALSAETTIRGLRLGRKMLSMLIPAADNQQLEACADCGAPVTASDPFIRYRGDYYHAHGCAETHPPALSRRQVRACPPRASRRSAQPFLNRPAAAEEIARVVAFEASPRASYMTGAVIAADGGRTAV